MVNNPSPQPESAATMAANHRIEQASDSGNDRAFRESMIPKSMPSAFDPMGGNRFSETITLQPDI
jgi:hypothetical protein